MCDGVHPMCCVLVFVSNQGRAKFFDVRILTASVMADVLDRGSSCSCYHSYYHEERERKKSSEGRGNRPRVDSLRPLSRRLRHLIYRFVRNTMNACARGRAVVSTNDRAQSGDQHAHTDQPVSLGVRANDAPRDSPELQLTKQRASHALSQTTIMAACYKDGVVLGADSRTSTGSYVANRVTDKLTKLSDHIYVCRSGSAADTQVS